MSLECPSSFSPNHTSPTYPPQEKKAKLAEYIEFLLDRHEPMNDDVADSIQKCCLQLDAGHEDLLEVRGLCFCIFLFLSFLPSLCFISFPFFSYRKVFLISHFLFFSSLFHFSFSHYYLSRYYVHTYCDWERREATKHLHWIKMVLSLSLSPPLPFFSHSLILPLLLKLTPMHPQFISCTYPCPSLYVHSLSYSHLIGKIPRPPIECIRRGKRKT